MAQFKEAWSKENLMNQEYNSNCNDVVQQARDAFISGRTKDVKFRKTQLKALHRMYSENESAFVEALSNDLRKPKHESILLELNMLKEDIVYMLSHIDDWVKPENVPANLVTIFDQSVIYHDPYGVVLVMGAWNYPVQLPLLPLSGAIAAGNCVIVKPSEIAPATAKTIADLLPKYLDPECYKVVCGGIPETTELLKVRFDYIFYTGSTHVGKIVRDAANRFLTPTTLELGGKSPVYLDDSVDMEIAVRRILWGKCINLGQTCVAPDYVLCNRSAEKRFLAEAKRVLVEWYGERPQDSPDLCRIVNERHFDRLSSYLNDGTVALGGSVDRVDKWIEPTVLVNVRTDSKVMTEEIFGPILPIVTVESASEAIEFINSREKPLSFYAFSNNEQLVDTMLREIYFGGACINDVVFHLAVPGLPFGGVGHSGMGAYHGKASYDCFTHRKSCLVRNYNKIADYIGKNRYPPYSEKKTKFLSEMLKERSLPIPSIRAMGYVCAFALGALALYAGQQIAQISANDD